ncbi:MAG: 50S ribosomal protein L24 [Candidatus Peregrinibacteria bacterium]|nr:50S ribosomal protein L24 [Candidatus Peregrinibacteria bacterium]
MKIKTGDNVVVIAGKYKGKTGKIMRVMKKTNKIVVEKMNIRIKHMKKTQSRPGEIIRYEAPFDASNVMLIDPKSGKRTRVGYKKLENGKKIRIAKVSGDELDKSTTAKSKK